MKGGTSKANLIKIALLLAATLSATVICTLIYPIFHPTSLWYLGLLAVMLSAAWLLVGFRPRRTLEGLPAVQIVIVYVLFYLILIYLLGLVTGFLKNGYSLAPLTMLGNVLPVLGVTVLTELTRYALVKRIGDHRGGVVMIILAFAALSIIVGSRVYNLAVPLELFEFVGKVGLGSIAASMMLTFVAWKSDFRPTLVYALILGVYPLVVPILPDLGPFIYSVLAILLPTLLFMRFNEFFVTRRPIPGRHKRSGRIIATVPALTVLATVVVLVSGIFRYWAMAIGSDSMSPEIDTGDVVIIDKDFGDVAAIAPGTVVAFRHDGRVITHRLVEVVKSPSGLKIQTKGDNNKDNDAWTVSEGDMVGIVQFRLPLVGWPTVWIDKAF